MFPVLTDAAVPTKSDRSMLDTKEMFRLCQSIQADRDQILADRPSRADLAAKYTASLGFRVTIHNILRALRTTGIEYRQVTMVRVVRTPVGVRTTRRSYRDEFRKLIGDLVNKVRVLEEEVTRMKTGTQGYTEPELTHW